jgi:16S rRNA (adenine1518-N6/adenine1519-N6)-dimethyltransferase
MKVTRPSELKALLADRGIHPSKALGQNFLVDENLARIILDIARIGEEDGVLEIGPGAGVLTEGLLQRARRVVAIEKDRRLAAWLRERLGADPRLTLIEADALETDLDAWLADGLTRVVSNLPYSVGTRILVNLIHAKYAPERITVTLQSDVGARLTAPPGVSTYGLLSVWAQQRYVIRVEKNISSTCFYPVPDVQSAVISLWRRSDRPVVPHCEQAYLELTRFCFSHRRKQMGKLLQMGPPGRSVDERTALRALKAIGFDGRVRPGEIGADAWVCLSNALAEEGQDVG